MSYTLLWDGLVTCFQLFPLLKWFIKRVTKCFTVITIVCVLPFTLVSNCCFWWFNFSNLDFILFLHSCIEPYNYFGRRGRKEPEALAAASLKRLFVENQPYLVSGYSQHALYTYSPPSDEVDDSKFLSLQRLRSYQLDAPDNILSMAKKYKYMRETFHKRLAFGKNKILCIFLGIGLQDHKHLFSH